MRQVRIRGSRRGTAAAVLLAVSMTTLLPAAGNGDNRGNDAGVTREWALLFGRVRLAVPANWIPMTSEQLVGESICTGSLQVGLARPDGRVTLGLTHEYVDFEAPALSALRPRLADYLRERGWEISEISPARLADREFLFADVAKVMDGRTVVNIVAAAPVSGRLLVIVITASGEDAPLYLADAHLALMSLKINEADGAEAAVPRELPVLNPPGPPHAPPPSVAAADADLTPLRTLPGTGVSLQVPENLWPNLLSPGYATVAGDNGFYIIPSGLPYEAARHLLDRHTLRRRGFELRESETVTVDGRPGTLVLAGTTEDEGPGGRWLLVFGDDKRSVSISAIYTPEMKAVLRRALLSTKWDSATADPLEGLGLTLSETARLRILCRAHRRLVLAPAGSQVPVDRAESFLVVNVVDLNGQGHTPRSVAFQALADSSVQHGFRLAAETERSFGDRPGYELKGSVIMTGYDLEMDFYQAVIINGTRACIVEGFQNPYGAVDLAPDFVQVAESVDFRQKWEP